MKVLHIITSSRGGAGIAALRLHEALCESGVSSAYLSVNRTINFENKTIADSFFNYQKPSFFEKIKTKFQHYFLATLFQKTTKRLNLIKQDLHCEIATLPFSDYKLHEHPLVQEADIINLHWVAGILDYSTFFENCNKPIVWTFHDMNPFQGLFHYKNDEVANAKTASKLDDEIKLVKAKAIQKIQKGVVVTPSKWMLVAARESKVFSHFTKTHIPNAIDFTVFCPQDKTSLRAKHHIAPNDFVLLFVAEDVSNIRKGFYLLQEALVNLKKTPITVLAIGKGVIPVNENIKIISLGEISSPVAMAACYAMADAFVLPSLEDNLPNVMLEAFACGIPLIGFSIGGIAEHTKIGFTGVLANEISSLSLAEAIATFYKTKENYKSGVIVQYAKDHFNKKQQAKAYIEIYNGLLG
ncbi:glycosyltransferase [Flavobacterium sp.]|uniref:glycosyltransferase n=1 Tax=Flavobacterium sp. TaxID=239 RepID=UPI00286B9BB5|nr:glycosyltransferase [Flavobacterium sp.]